MSKDLIIYAHLEDMYSLDSGTKYIVIQGTISLRDSDLHTHQPVYWSDDGYLIMDVTLALHRTQTITPSFVHGFLTITTCTCIENVMFYRLFEDQYINIYMSWDIS